MRTTPIPSFRAATSPAPTSTQVTRTGHPPPGGHPGRLHPSPRRRPPDRQACPRESPGTERVVKRSLSCSSSCSSPASSIVHGSTRRAVTCTDGRWWTCRNAERRTLNPPFPIHAAPTARHPSGSSPGAAAGRFAGADRSSNRDTVNSSLVTGLPASSRHRCGAGWQVAPSGRCQLVDQ